MRLRLQQATLNLCLLAVTSCATFNFEPPARKVIPDDRLGCSQYKGKEKAECISALIEAYENFRNAEVEEIVLSERRHNEYWVIVTYKYCFVYEGKPLDCFQLEQAKKDRTWKGAFQEHMYTGIPAMIIGFYTGLKVN